MSEEDVTDSHDPGYHRGKNDKIDTDSDTESDSEDTKKACMRIVWKPLNKRARFQENLKSEGAGCNKSNDAFDFAIESSVVVETIEEKSRKEEGNNNVIGAGKFRVHEGIWSR